MHFIFQGNFAVVVPPGNGNFIEMIFLRCHWICDL